MSELFEKSIRVLELPRLLEMLEHHAVSAEAKARARRLAPSDDFGEVNRLLDETDAARKMIMLRGSPAFGGVRDVGEALSRAERGGMLNTRELLNIAGLLTNVRRVQDYYKEDEEGTVIDKLFLSCTRTAFWRRRSRPRSSTKTRSPTRPRLSSRKFAATSARRRPRAARSCSASFRPRATGTFCRTR